MAVTAFFPKLAIKAWPGSAHRTCDEPGQRIYALYSVVAPSAPVTPNVGNVDLPFDSVVCHFAIAFRFYDEIAADTRGVDLTGAVVLYGYRALNVGGVNASGAVALDGERAGNIAREEVAFSIPHSHVAADVLDDEISRAVGDAPAARTC